jgi:uncharacterized protein (UPF0371 family)
MGNYRIEIEAAGGHGCQRELKDGQIVPGCMQESCPDCAARALVDWLKHKGNTMVSAKLIHWPGQQGSVEDDLLTGIRKGSF